MPIRLQVLGGLHAFRDDVPLAWVPAQHISSALLVYLALERDVTREQLARVFWPDEELEAARHALRQALYRLRHAAGDGLIEDTGDVLRLSVPVACDALDLERAVDAGDFGAAMALYGGAFLKDVSLSASREFEAWTDRQRARFGRLYRRACRARIETLVGGGDVHLALDAARAWVMVEPFDDEAQHRLIELLAGSGQRAEALAQYERYERLLKGEELEPLDETKALVAMLRAGEVGSGAIVPVPLPQPGLAAQTISAAQLAGARAASGDVIETGTLAARARLRWFGKRWPLAAAAGIVLVSLGIAGVWAVSFRPAPGRSVFWGRTPPTREPVVVLPFEVRGSSPGLEDLGIQAADRITAALEAAKVGRVVAFRPERAGEAFAKRSLRRIVAETGAITLVTGVIARRGKVLEVQASVVRASDLGTVWTLGPERGSAAEPTVVLDAIRERVVGAVAWYLSPWLGMDAMHPEILQPYTSLEVVRLGNKAAELMGANRGADAIPLLQEASAMDTTSMGPVMGLVSVYNGLGRWQQRDSALAFVEARRERLAQGNALALDLVQAFYGGSPEEQLKAARAYAAAEPRKTYEVMFGALRARRPREALSFLPEWRLAGAWRETTDAWGRAWQYTDVIAAEAYHMLDRFEEELVVARAAKAREPRYFGHWTREASALAALGRTGEVERIITESHSLETQGAPVRLMYTVALELSRHGWPVAARGYAERLLAGLAQWPGSLRSVDAVEAGSPTAGAIQVDALRILGRHDEAARISNELSRRAGAQGLGWRLLGMRSRVLAGDTVGGLALADSARTQPLTAFADMKWIKRGLPMYYGAHVLSLLGRKEAAVAMLREALNNGWRLLPDEPLQWYWEPIKDYPPFQELVKIR